MKNIFKKIEQEIDRQKRLSDGKYNPRNLHELELELRRLADRAQVAGSPFIVASR